MKRFKVYRLSLEYGTYQIGKMIYQPATHFCYDARTRAKECFPSIVIEAENEWDAVYKAHQIFSKTMEAKNEH